MLKIDKILFRTDRVEVVVLDEANLTAEARHKFTTLISEQYPEALSQDCRNSHGSKFCDCLETTSLAHVLEHIIICNMQKTAADFPLFEESIGSGAASSERDCVREFPREKNTSSFCNEDTGSLLEKDDGKTRNKVDGALHASEISNRGEGAVPNSLVYAEATDDDSSHDARTAKSQSRITRSLIFVGKTTKIGPNLAKIELKYYDDIHALGAIKRSIEDVNKMLNACLD